MSVNRNEALCDGHVAEAVPRRSTTLAAFDAVRAESTNNKLASCGPKDGPISPRRYSLTGTVLRPSPWYPLPLTTPSVVFLLPPRHLGLLEVTDTPPVAYGGTIASSVSLRVKRVHAHAP